MAEPVAVMVPAPPLPAPSDTQPHLPPAEGALGRPAMGVAPEPEPRARMASRAAAVHGGFLAACGRSQAGYLGVMTEAAARLAGPARRRLAAPGEGPTPPPRGPEGTSPASAPAIGSGDGAAPPPHASNGAEIGLALAVAAGPIGPDDDASPRAPDGVKPGPPQPPAARPVDADGAPEGDAALAAWLAVRGDDLLLDLTRAPWLADHRPDHGVAVLPMTAAVEIVAASAQALAPGRRVVRVRDLSLRSWIVLGREPLRLRRRVERRADGSAAVTLLAWREAARAALSRDEPVASGVVELADAHPPPPPELEPLAAPEPVSDPYASAELFHGPAFQVLHDLRADGGGASAAVDLGASPAPVGVLHPVALDAALQVGAVKRWGEWCGAEVGAGKCLPVRLVELTLHGPTPRDGPGRVEMRGRGVDGHPRFPVLEFTLHAGARVWARMTVVFVAVPEGPLDAYPAPLRRAHLRDRAFRPGVRVSTLRDGTTTLRDEDLAAAEWIPRTIQLAYGIEGAEDATLAVAMREHAAARFGVHPSEVALDGPVARCAARPGEAMTLRGARDGRAVAVRDAE